MAWAPDYVTASQLKSALAITGTADDTELGFAITAASRAVDQFCGRQFGVISSAVARYYYPAPGHAIPWRRRGIFIDDLMTTTDLVVKVDTDADGVYETTLTLDTDYELHPLNAAADSRPWTRIVEALNASICLTPRVPVEVTAEWGWTAVPTEVVQATIIQAARFFKRKNAPFGVAGSPDQGSELRLLARVDPDVAVLLSGVRLYWAA
jgi:hypothetical protein